MTRCCAPVRSPSSCPVRPRPQLPLPLLDGPPPNCLESGLILRPGDLATFLRGIPPTSSRCPRARGTGLLLSAGSSAVGRLLPSLPPSSRRARAAYLLCHCTCTVPAPSTAWDLGEQPCQPRPRTGARPPPRRRGLRRAAPRPPSPHLVEELLFRGASCRRRPGAGALAAASPPLSTLPARPAGGGPGLGPWPLPRRPCRPRGPVPWASLGPAL